MKNLKNYMYLFLGQLISLSGSALTNFTLGIWVLKNTNSVFSFSMILFIANIPALIITPFAGVIIDKVNKKKLLMLCDGGSAVISITLLSLLSIGNLKIQYIYIIVCLLGILANLRWPTYTAIIPKVVNSENLSKANGMDQISQAVSILFAPVLGGILINMIGLTGIVFIDTLSYVISLGLLIFVKYKEVFDKVKIRIKDEFITGLKYVLKTKDILYFILLIAILNFSSGALSVIITPMLLTVTNEFGLGLILSISGLGMLIGSIAFAFLPDIKNKAKIMFLSAYVYSACFILISINSSVIIYPIIGFIIYFMVAVIGTLNQTFLQNKVHSEFQGRIFAIRRVFIVTTNMIGILLTGLITEKLFKPIMQSESKIIEFLNIILGSNTKEASLLLFIIGVVSMILVGFMSSKIMTNKNESITEKNINVT